MEVPPAVALGGEAVGHEVQRTVVRPLRVDDRLAGESQRLLEDGIQRAVDRPGGLAGDLLRRDRTPGRVQLGDVQLGAVPGHRRVIPGNPAEPAPVRAQTRRRVEVRALGDRERQLAALEVERDDGLDQLAVPLGVGVLHHAVDEAALRVDREIAVPRVTVRGDRNREQARLLTVDPLILRRGEIGGREVGEADEAVSHRHRAAAVRVHERPRAVAAGRHLLRPAGRRPAHHDVAPLLVGTHFHPVDVGAVDRDLLEAPRPARDRVGRDRRGPFAVGQRSDGSGIVCARLSA